MSRLSLVLLLVLATLTGCASSPLSAPPARSATVRTPPAPTPPPPPAPAQRPAPPSSLLDPEVVVKPLQLSKEIFPSQGQPLAQPQAQTPAQQSHIALLLPLQSRGFGRWAEMVRDGFLAAAEVQPLNGLPVKVYPLENEGDALLLAYEQATIAGARCIVAGLTRSGAAAIAASSTIKAPTLALNQVDQISIPAAPFYTLSLSMEDDARRVARLMASEGINRVAALAGPDPLSKRIRAAFEQEWARAGGELTNKIQLGDDISEYSKLRPALRSADAIFISAESSLVRQAMPYLARGVPVYSTAQVYDGKTAPGANVDLQGIRFVDMPWLVEPSHAAVAVYPRPTKLVGADLERFYALGIDAYRLAYMMVTKESLGHGFLDGVTGELILRDNHRFQRDPIPAYFEGEQVAPLKLPQ